MIFLSLSLSNSAFHTQIHLFKERVRVPWEGQKWPPKDSCSDRKRLRGRSCPPGCSWESWACCCGSRSLGFALLFCMMLPTWLAGFLVSWTELVFFFNCREPCYYLYIDNAPSILNTLPQVSFFLWLMKSNVIYVSFLKLIFAVIYKVLCNHLICVYFVY